MHGFGRQRNEIPKCVVSSSRLRKPAIRLHFYGMDEVREFDGILDEKNGDVVSDQVPVSFLSVKLDRKSAYVPRSVDGARTACNGRYASKYRRFLTHLREYPGSSIFLQRSRQLEESVDARRSRVNDTFGNTLMVEMSNFFAENEIFQKHRAARIGF